MPEAFWTALLGALAGGGVLAFVVRGLFQQLLSRDLERFRAELQVENATALERFRADLRHQNFRRERLHDMRLELVADIYAQLYETIQAVNRALYAESDVDSAIVDARDGINSLHRRVAKGIPFVTSSLADRLNKVNLRLRHVHLRVESDRGQRGDRWQEAIGLLADDVGPMLTDLAEDLRIFLEGDHVAGVGGVRTIDTDGTGG